MRFFILFGLFIYSYSIQAQSRELIFNTDVIFTNIINSSEQSNLFYSFQTRNQLNFQVSNLWNTRLIIGGGGTFSYIWDRSWISGFSSFDENYPMEYGFYLNSYVGWRLLEKANKLNIDVRLNNYYFLNKSVWIKNGSNRFFNELNVLLNKYISDNFSLGICLTAGLKPPFKGEIGIVGTSGIIHIDEYVDVFGLGCNIHYRFNK